MFSEKERMEYEKELMLKRLFSLKERLDAATANCHCGGYDCYDCYQLEAVDYIITGKEE